VTRPATTYFFESLSLRIAPTERDGDSEITLCREDHPVPLSETESKTLQMLVEKRGEFIRKDALVDHVCGKDSPHKDKNVVDKAINGLRKALADSKEDARLIRTEIGGYKFVASVQSERDESTDNTAPTARLEEGAPSTQIDEHQSALAPARAVSENTFEEWMIGHGRGVTLAFFVCVILTSAVSIWLYLSPGLSDQAKPFACLAQALVILVAFAHSLLLARPRGFGSPKLIRENDIKDAGYENGRDLNSDSDKIRRALTQYSNYWRWLLISWLCLYGFLAILGFKGLDLSSLIASPVAEMQLLGIRLSLFNTLLNNWNTAMLFLCFYILNKQMKDESAKRNLVDTPFIGVAFFLMIVLTTVFEFMSVANISKSFIPKGASLASGIAGAIAMALLVGRLQSKFLGPRLWLLIALYSYTAIQPLFLYLEKNDIWAVALINFALLLKCLLYLYTAWLFQSGDLLFYFARVRRIYRTVPQQRTAFRMLLD
jgi:DNA-binding winged helix-turn-helix (wHTH) protein